MFFFADKFDKHVAMANVTKKLKNRKQKNGFWPSISNRKHQIRHIVLAEKKNKKPQQIPEKKQNAKVQTTGKDGMNMTTVHYYKWLKLAMSDWRRWQTKASVEII